MSEHFPGSRRVLTPPTGPPDILDGLKSVTFNVRGEPMEFYTITELGKALNRQPVTLRKWERAGILPRATFSKPGANKDPRGRRRLYSRPQMEALVRIAHEVGVLGDTHKQISRTAFKSKAWAAFTELANG